MLMKKLEMKINCAAPRTNAEIGNEHIHRLLRLEERVLSRIVETSHLSADAENVHREEDAVNADEAQPEMNLAERFVHEPAEHFREPEIESGERREQRRDCHHQMEVRDDEVGILQVECRPLTFRGRCRSIRR